MTMWFRSLLSSPKPRQRVRRFSRPRALRLQALDDRCLPSTFTVTSLLDTGPGSLREAVIAANSNPGADTIDFGVTGSIGLTGGQLDITDSVTIAGPGAGALTVSGEDVSRVFGIAGNPIVVIADLTVANGLTWGSPGGGIAMAGGTVTLDHVTVSGNAAGGVENGYGVGGGLYVAGGTLGLEQCTVSGNVAAGSGSSGDGVGGGLCVTGGTVSVNRSTVTGNGAYGGTGADGVYTSGSVGGEGAGGGLCVAGGTVHVTQSTVSGNAAWGGPGGNGQAYSEAVYGGSGGRGIGGGVRVVAGTVEFDQCSISGNTAGGGSPGMGTYPGEYGASVGGGLSIASAAPPLADLDDFTLSNTVNNVANVDPDISGPYTVNGVRVPSLAISDVSIREGNGGTTAFVFTVSLSAASTQAVSVRYATADAGASAGGDYQAAAGTLTIPAGQTTGTITVPVNGDRLPESNETFFVNLSSPTTVIVADGRGVGTILDDEPWATINDVTVAEGNAGTMNATFTVSLSVAYDVPVTVHYETTNGSATAGSDYVAASGDVVIAAGQTTTTLPIAVIGDRSAEFTENFVVNVRNTTNGFVFGSWGTGTILDDEPRIRIGDVTRAEGKNRTTTVFTFTVTLSAAYDQAVTMSFRTADGTATAGGDYAGKTGTLTFAPGETTKTITITVNGDNKREANETFSVDLFGLIGNAMFSNSRGVGTILNDD
jgi:hypothetical protein